MKTISLTILLLVAFMTTSFAQTEWTFDKAHSRIGFSVTHMIITDVEGNFKSFNGMVTTKGDTFDNAKISFEADANSVFTDNEKRDKHLASEDFFNAAAHPKVTFKSKSMEKAGGNKYKLIGDLTMRGITKTVTLDVKYGGTNKGPYGKTRAGFKIGGTVNRFDFGLKWNALMEAGGAVVGKEVELLINIEIIRKG